VDASTREQGELLPLPANEASSHRSGSVTGSATLKTLIGSLRARKLSQSTPTTPMEMTDSAAARRCTILRGRSGTDTGTFKVAKGCG
jgi:hypothetical protein